MRPPRGPKPKVQGPKSGGGRSHGTPQSGGPMSRKPVSPIGDREKPVGRRPKPVSTDRGMTVARGTRSRPSNDVNGILSVTESRHIPRSAASRVAPSPGTSESGERLQKVLAHAGVASRRAAEEMIAAG